MGVGCSLQSVVVSWSQGKFPGSSPRKSSQALGLPEQWSGPKGYERGTKMLLGSL